jgi:tetratricopeptide (TPR) repeat protein
VPDEKHIQHSRNQQEEVTPVNDNVVEQQLEQYHRLASDLRESTNIDEAGPALNPLVNMTQADQIAYLKALGQEDSSDAADIAQAMFNLAPDKEVRKEARSTLLRLEAQDIYPQWTVTPEGLVFSSVTAITPEDSPSREETDLQDKTLLGLNSLLQDLEDFFDSLPSTPTLEPVTALLESWAEGDPEEAYNALSVRSPLRDGLDVDAWIEHRTQWLEAADTGLVKITYVGEKDQLAPDCVVVEATWSLPIGNPTAEHPPKDLPTATCVSQEKGRHWFWTSYVVVEEDGEWHITDMTDEGATALQLPLEEIERILREKAAKASQRLAKLEDEEDEDLEDFDEDDFDEDDLDFEDFEDDEDFEDFDEDDLEDEEDEQEEETLNFLQEMEEVIREATQAMHYHDAFILQAPDDSPAVYESAVEFAQIVQDVERAAVYFQQMAHNLPEHRGTALRGLALMYEQILQDYLGDNPEDPEPEKQRYNTLIEETLRQAIESDRTTRSHILLADVLIRQNKNLDEAKTLLKTAQPSATEDEEIISIEAGLAQIAQSHDQKEEALQHYQTVARLEAEFPHIWFKIGSLQRQLGATDEALVNLRRSIKQEPDLVEAYIELSVIHSEQKQFSKARDILRKALDKFPDSVDLLASLSIVYAKSGDLRSAQRYLEQAEMVDEQNSFVPIARATLQSQKEHRPPTAHATPTDRHQPKHRSHKNRKK